MDPSGSKYVRRPEAVRVWLLGGFRVSVGSRTIEEGTWRLRKAAALVKLLALAPGHRMLREHAMELLWPDSGRKAASNSLRKTLHAARTTLDPAEGSGYLASEDDSLVLCPGGNLWVDVDAFEEAAATARRAKEPATYRAAIDLYAGELLPGDRYEGWAEERRQPLRETYLSLLLGLARLYEGHGDYESAIETLRGVLESEPAREEAHASLLRLYALLGRKGEALEQYGRLKDILSRELGTEPSASSRDLRAEIAADCFPPKENHSSGSSGEGLSGVGRHNLPAPRNSFVGREPEITEFRRELAMTRLLTLTGVGGSGKTRLALEVARDLVELYAEGVWLVELAGLSEGDLVPQAVARTLGVREQPGQPLTDTLIDALRPKNVLLVLDNCEHLMDATARLVDVLLNYCSHLRILATSREALDVAGEARWSVPALSLPNPRRPQTVAELESSAAARLFVERASDRRSDFKLEPANTQTVAEICRRLEGIPLAIELAAARVGTLSVEQLSERLNDSLKLLTCGGRTAVTRQRTLTTTLDWSYELLDEPERVLFRRLSVFAGGWTLEAAQAVGMGEDVEEGDVLERLSGLVNKSLVVVDATEGDGMRYRLLEPVRQYAREKLEDSGEIGKIQRRHAELFLALAEEAKTKLPGPEETWWLHRLGAEHDNLRAALSWSLDEDHALGLRLAAALWWFWRSQGHLGEGASWLEAVLGRDDRAEPAARAAALYGLGDNLAAQGDFEQAQACFEEALMLYKELGYRGGVAETLASLGYIALEQDDTREAKAFFEKSLRAGQGLENWRDVPRILSGLAWSASDDGDFEQTQKLCREALTIHWEQGEALGAASVLNSMGYIELAWGNQERATESFEEALTLGRELEHEWTVSQGLSGLGLTANLQGDPERAKTLLKDSLALYLKLERKAELAEYMEGLAEAAAALGQDVRAARLWGAAATIRRADRPWSPTELLLHEPLLATARSRMNEAVWESAFAEGESMNVQKAVEYALSEEDDAATSTSHAPDESVDHTQQPALTRREEEIVVLVARGLTNLQIASELSISEHTAATHVRRILKKLGLQSRAQIGSWLAEQRP